MTSGAVLRSLVFALLQFLVTPIWAALALLTFPLSPLARYRIITAWSRLIIRGAEVICGIRYRVLGTENIPREPCVIIAKHESAWETLAFQSIFPPQVWVIKRELLWIPFFGWGLAMLSPIAIDRRAGPRALKQMIEQGRDRLRRGFNIVIFPEGTRVAPGETGVYQTGGAWLAGRTGAPMLPVAHNAGTYWPKNAWVKRPGVITVSIGPLVHTEGEKPAAVMQNIARWIETETQRLRASEAL
jgi:1-acyl-sn-glycerol-3-phosphate acyltransferase